MKKKMHAMGLTLATVLSLTACGSNNSDKNAPSTLDYKISMVTNVGGVNDQSFCQSAWKGMQELRDEYGASVSYIESIQEGDYASNLDKMVDAGNDLVWAVGFAMADAAYSVAEMNVEQQFGIIDHDYGDGSLDNMVAVMFDAQESSFLAGYAAGLTTQTDKVGFVGGIGSKILDQFEYGYRAGVAYAAKELGKEIEVTVQYAESFVDAAKAKGIANKMYTANADIIFQAAGTAGLGVIEAAKDHGKWAIGVDMDQYHVAPDVILTSAVKRVDEAIKKVSAEYIKGNDMGGQTLVYGLDDGAVGLPEENPNLDPEVYNKAMELQDAIIAGDIVVPYDAETFANFSA